MARVTVEDCLDKIENRFELVLLASYAARLMSSGQYEAPSHENEKDPVRALRGIANNSITPGDLREGLIHSLQKLADDDTPEEANSADNQPTSFAEGEGEREEAKFDRMTEDDLLRGLEALVPPSLAEDDLD